MKKIIAAVLLIFIMVSFSGCATITYVFFVDEVMGYSTIIEAEIPAGEWNSKGYNKQQLKEFLYDFSFLWRGVENVRYDEEVVVYEFGGLYSAVWSLSFVESDGNYYFTDSLEFGDEADYAAYYGLDEEEPEESRDVDYGIFTQSITLQLANPFAGFYDNINNAGAPDIYKVFLDGYNGFAGFKERFPAISVSDAENIALGYIFACMRSYKGVDHEDHRSVMWERQYYWSFDISNLDSKTITLKYTIPNPVGWYTLSILLAPIIGYLFYLLFKSQHKSRERKQRMQLEFIQKYGYNPQMFGNNNQQRNPDSFSPYSQNNQQGNINRDPFDRQGTPSTRPPFEEYSQPENRPYFGQNAQQNRPQYFGNYAQPTDKAQAEQNNKGNDGDDTAGK